MTHDVTLTGKFRESAHLQAVESNPLDSSDRALFARFERDGLSPDERRAVILAEVAAETLPAAE